MKLASCRVNHFYPACRWLLQLNTISTSETQQDESKSREDSDNTFSKMVAQKPSSRIRDWGYSPGRFPTGPRNSVLDVPGAYRVHRRAVIFVGRRRRKLTKSDRRSCRPSRHQQGRGRAHRCDGHLPPRHRQDDLHSMLRGGARHEWHW